MMPSYTYGATRLYTGDCLAVLATLPENSIDTILTDPPYGLDFMGKKWDGVVPSADVWRAVLRVAKPGAMLLAFGGTRTYHRLACAIEDAGWELRDCLMWLYGSGFPKSLDISKAIDKAAGAERELGPKRVSADGTVAHDRAGVRHEGYERPWRSDAEAVERNTRISYPATDAAKHWQGYGTALKPAWEPIILAMKPLDGTFAENAVKHGVAGLHIDGGRIGTTEDLNGGAYSDTGRKSAFFNHLDATSRQYVQPSGRWPANVLLDETAAACLDAQSGELTTHAGRGTFVDHNNRVAFGKYKATTVNIEASSGGASRFFYVAKASGDERGEGNTHPTVKPLDLLRYLCILTQTPTGGVILDPFMGSGSTIAAAHGLGRPAIGIELDPAYVAIARQRLDDTQGGLPL